MGTGEVFKVMAIKKYSNILCILFKHIYHHFQTMKDIKITRVNVMAMLSEVNKAELLLGSTIDLKALLVSTWLTQCLYWSTHGSPSIS